MERIEKRLSSWKGKYPSSKGHLTLMKSFLASIPIYLYFYPVSDAQNLWCEGLRNFSETSFGMLQKRGGNITW